MIHDAHVAPFEYRHIWPVAMHMREADRNEVRASHGSDPLSALINSVQCSLLRWSIMKGPDVIGIFGVGAPNLFYDRGSPWLLATPQLEEISLTFLRQSRQYVARMLAQHSFLENWVDARNVTSIKWLKWCGFDFDDPAPFGVEGLPFHRFEMRK